MSAGLLTRPRQAATSSGPGARLGIIQNSAVGAALVFAYVFIDYTGFSLPFANVGPISVYPRDLLTVLLAMAATARFLRAGRYDRRLRLLVTFAVLVLLAVVRGMLEIDIGVAVNEARDWLWFVFSAAYFAFGTASEPHEVRDRFGVYLVRLASVLAVVAVLRWVALATGLSLGPVFTPDPGEIRVFDAAHSAVIAQGFFVLAPRFPTAPPRIKLLTAALLATPVLLQHRTVWAMLLVGLAALALRRPRMRRTIAALAVGAVVVSLLAATVVFDWESEQLEARATNTQTFGWRVAGWQALVEQSLDAPPDLLLGQPFGKGWAREVDGIVRTESPHSFYVEGLLRVGLIGMAVLLAVVVGLLREQLRRPPEHPGGRVTMSGDVIFALLASLLTFSVTYFAPLTAGPIIGFSVAVYRGRRAGAGGRV